MKGISATVHSGNLGRWFEQLCRIECNQIREIANGAGDKMTRKVLPDCGAVYAFWWTGELSVLGASIDAHCLILKGPKGRSVELAFNREWLGIEAGAPVPLYVRKTTAGLRKRIPQHFMLGSKRILPLGGSGKKAKPPTTSCQLRAGIEHRFPPEKDSRRLILENIGLSDVGLDGDLHAANRFYLEDLAIGLMRPLLNVDVER